MGRSARGLPSPLSARRYGAAYGGLCDRYAVREPQISARRGDPFRYRSAYHGDPNDRSRIAERIVVGIHEKGAVVFTGIIQAVGRIAAIESGEQDIRLCIESGKLPLEGVSLGDSIATSGVCLTVTELTGEGYWADVSPESLSLTTLGTKGVGDSVNLETSLTLSTPLGGHLVSGHVDGVGHVDNIIEDARFWRVRIAAPETLARYVAMKGSICVDGTSLTVNQVEGCHFELTIIPQTWEETVFSEYRVGSPVNLEVDVIARYLERLMQFEASAEAT